jgi:hypothetical protein
MLRLRPGPHSASETSETVGETMTGRESLDVSARENGPHPDTAKRRQLDLEAIEILLPHLVRPRLIAMVTATSRVPPLVDPPGADSLLPQYHHP